MTTGRASTNSGNTDSPISAAARVREAVNRTRASRRRNTIGIWVIAALLAVVCAVAYANRADEIERQAYGTNQRNARSFDTPLEQAMAEWKQLSETWRAQQRAAAKASSTGSHWTARDDDAYRILRNVMGRLETLRRREARQEDTAYWWDLVRRDRLEWKALVEDATPEFPTGR